MMATKNETKNEEENAKVEDEAPTNTRVIGTKVKPIFGDDLICSAGALRAMASGLEAHEMVSISVVDGQAFVRRYNGNTGVESDIPVDENNQIIRG
jgi:hypothetical protein